MSSRERAQAAQVAINNASRTLAEAIQAKFTYGAASSSKDTGVLTDALLEETVTTAYAGVVVLREIYFGDEYSAQRLTFERGLATLLFRCVAVQMVWMKLLCALTPSISNSLTCLRPQSLTSYACTLAVTRSRLLPSQETLGLET